MIFGQGVKTKNGMLLIAKGYEANCTILLKLKKFNKSIGIEEPIKVMLPINIEDLKDKEKNLKKC